MIFKRGSLTINIFVCVQNFKVLEIYGYVYVIRLKEASARTADEEKQLYHGTTEVGQQVRIKQVASQLAQGQTTKAKTQYIISLLYMMHTKYIHIHLIIYMILTFYHIDILYNVRSTSQLYLIHIYNTLPKDELFFSRIQYNRLDHNCIFQYYQIKN